MAKNQEIEQGTYIPGYKRRYAISTLGRVKCLYGKNNAYGGSIHQRDLIMKPQQDSKGYLRIQISLDGHKVTKKIHRLVAQAFIPNPDNLPQVNHIDGNKLNNCVDNLEGCDNQQNQKHAGTHGLQSGTGVIRKTLEGKEVDRWPTMTEAARQVNGHSSCIQQVCTGKRRTYKGYKGSYIKNY